MDFLYTRFIILYIFYKLHFTFFKVIYEYRKPAYFAAITTHIFQLLIQPSLSKIGVYRIRSMKSLFVCSVWKIGTRSNA